MKGTIIKFWSDIVEVKFKKEDLPLVNHLLTTHEGKTFLLVKRVLNDTTVRAIVIYASKEISMSDVVINTKQGFMVPVGKQSKNNIYGFQGEPMLNATVKPKYIEMDSIINNERSLNMELKLVETQF